MEKQGSSKNEGSINPDAAPAAADLSGSGDFDSDTQSSEQQDAEATLDREIDDWGEQITAAYKKSVQDVIDLGKLLFKAKRALGHGNFRTMFDRGKVPFGQRTAEMLIAIAEHPMSNAKFISVLPQSWGTLYELTGLPEPELVSMLENGTINADTTREDVKEIFDELKKKGVYDFRQLIAALKTIIKFWDKWHDDVREPARHIVDGVEEGSGAEEEGGVNLATLSVLPDWIEKLHAECTKLLREEADYWERRLAKEKAEREKHSAYRFRPSWSARGRQWDYAPYAPRGAGSEKQDTDSADEPRDSEAADVAADEQAEASAGDPEAAAEKYMKQRFAESDDATDEASLEKEEHNHE